MTTSAIPRASRSRLNCAIARRIGLREDPAAAAPAHDSGRGAPTRRLELRRIEEPAPGDVLDIRTIEQPPVAPAIDPLVAGAEPAGHHDLRRRPERPREQRFILQRLLEPAQSGDHDPVHRRRRVATSRGPAASAAVEGHRDGNGSHREARTGVTRRWLLLRRRARARRPTRRSAPRRSPSGKMPAEDARSPARPWCARPPGGRAPPGSGPPAGSGCSGVVIRK